MLALFRERLEGRQGQDRIDGQVVLSLLRAKKGMTRWPSPRVRLEEGSLPTGRQAARRWEGSWRVCFFGGISEILSS